MNLTPIGCKPGGVADKISGGSKKGSSRIYSNMNDGAGPGIHAREILHAGILPNVSKFTVDVKVGLRSNAWRARKARYQ